MTALTTILRTVTAALLIAAAAPAARAQQTPLQDKPFAEHKIVLQLSDNDPRKQGLVLSVTSNLMKHYDPDKVAIAGDLLYRRGKFNGTMDQLICDALRHELDAELALSPGFRWGNTMLPGEAITMGDLLSETAITYPEVYVQDMTGAQIKTILEDICDNLFNPDPYYQQGGDMVRMGGLDYACAPTQSVGNRISDMTLDDGKAIDAGKTYKVAGWASANPQQDKPVWDVFAAYLRREKAAKPKKLNRVALKGVSNNPGISG